MTDQIFDQLFVRGQEAILADTQLIDVPPADGGARYGISVILRPDAELTSALGAITDEAMAFCGPGHWPTGAPVAVHVTVRSLELHRHPVADDDAAVARYAAAIGRTAARGPGTLRFAVTGLTLTPQCVMCCLRPLDAGPAELASVLAEELGPDGWHEETFNRDIWYASLVHFTGPIVDPSGLIDWISARRRMPIGVMVVDELEVMRWEFNGRQVIPVALATAPLRRVSPASNTR